MVYTRLSNCLMLCNDKDNARRTFIAYSIIMPINLQYLDISFSFGFLYANFNFYIITEINIKGFLLN